MSDIQTITCNMVQLARDEDLLPIMASLFQVLSNRNAFRDDTEYLKSIPRYWEQAQGIANAPDSEWVDESEVVW